MSCTGCQLNKSDNTLTSSRVDMLTSYNWLDDLPDTTHLSEIVEVRFKGTRKEFFRNESKISIKRGDKVVVASAGGHDLGIVGLTGKLAQMQFDRKIKDKDRYQVFSIYRIARERDLERWVEAQKREKPVMIRSRQIANELNLNMKIGEVEFRGDGNKAIFYYIADGRVDFRELIKEYASEFHIKIEMKQIGARQEAALIGGIGSCGRELCCSSWRTDFTSISAHMATRQGLSPNAEKLTGRCGKLKCCLTYELDTYLESQDDFPKELLILETSAGEARHFKIDILQKRIWYSVVNNKTRLNFSLQVDKVKEIINLNKRGTKPELSSLLDPSLEEKADEKNMFNQNLTSDKKIPRNKKLRKKRTNNNNTQEPAKKKNNQRQRNSSTINKA
ncbi:MAG: regulatory iron-sulfur-containing complex subunit RicT [Prolixibacteraceae bacterium]|jgi:cell fate regulator YaaT (PSP1 superfamily)|nr:regulatory iron-sulfur-containing complex subunit RicT [Prolixibacteraceae bacterium]